MIKLEYPWFTHIYRIQNHIECQVHVFPLNGAHMTLLKWLKWLWIPLYGDKLICWLWYHSPRMHIGGSCYTLHCVWSFSIEQVGDNVKIWDDMKAIYTQCRAFLCHTSTWSQGENLTSRQTSYKWQQVWLCKSQKGLDDSCIKRTSKVICRQVEYAPSCVHYTCIMHQYHVSGCGVCLFVVVEVIIIKRNAFIHSYGKALDIIAHILINISTQLHTGNYNPIIRSAIVCWRIGQV